jgi:hypothetical protein
MKDRDLMMSGYDQVFLAEAEDCAERSRYGAEVKVSALRLGAAVSAVWAAAAAVDAFVSERSAFYRRYALEGHRRISKKTFRKILEEPRSWRKLNRLVKWFHEPGLKAHPAYRDFRAVLALRDATVRGNAEHLATDDWPPGFKPKFRNRIPVRADLGLDWTSWVFHEDTANWAAETCRAILVEASKHVPPPLTGAARKVHNGPREEIPQAEPPPPEYIPAQYPH